MKIKVHPFALIGALLALIFGFFCLFGNPNTIIGFIYYFIGTGLIISGITKILLFSRTIEGHSFYLYEGITNLVIGLIILLTHNFIVTLIIGAVFIVFPLIRIITTEHHKEAFMQELPLLVLGLIIMFSGDFFATVFVKIAGVLLIILGIYLIVGIIIDKRRMNKIMNDFYNEQNDDNALDGDIIDATYEERDLDE